MKLRVAFTAEIFRDNTTTLCDDSYLITQVEDFDGFIDFETDFMDAITKHLNENFGKILDDEEEQFFVFGIGNINIGEDYNENITNIDTEITEIYVYKRDK
jgi:hypothetical protein